MSNCVDHSSLKFNIQQLTRLREDYMLFRKS